MRHFGRIALFASIAASSACIDEVDDRDVGRSSSPVNPVSWTDAVGVSAVGNDLTKTAPETAFNAGAVSVQTLAGDGFVEFTTAEATADKIAGLSVGNGGQGLADIDFGIRLNASGRASIWEGGVNRGGIGPYTAGDVFRVEAEDGVVTYYRNGVLRYTSALAPSFPLLVDTSLRTPGATLLDVAIEPSDFWTAAIGVAVDGNDITKTAPETTFNAGALSLAAIESGDGYVEFTVADNTSSKAAGFGIGNASTSRADIEFAFSLNDTGGAGIIEAGIFRQNVGSYEAGDMFVVQVVAGVVTYWKEGVLVYTSEVVPSFPLRLDTALATPGAAILDAAIAAGPAPDCAALRETLTGTFPEQRLGEELDGAGDVLVVGDHLASPPVATVYRRSGSGWTFEQTLEPPGPVDSFATGVATDGQTIAVEATLVGGQRGAQVYRHDGAEWLPETFPAPCPDAAFTSLAVKDDLLVAGTLFEPAGAVQVYRRTGSAWTLEAVLQGEPGSSLGRLVAIGGNRIFATNENDVQIFRFDATLPDPPAPSCSSPGPGQWEPGKELRLPPLVQHMLWSMDSNASGDQLIVGDIKQNTAYVFSLVAGAWLRSELRGSPTASTFGEEISIGGPADGFAVISPGYVFARRAGAWRQVDRIVQGEGGGAVGAGADWIALGNPLSDLAGPNAGAVYLHDIDPVCVAD